MSTYALIQARLGSTRFKNKIMQFVQDKTLLQWCYDRVRMSNVDDVYVICPESDEKLIEFCQINGMNVLTGNEHDVLSRYYECAKELKADHVVRITSDNSVIDPVLINQLLLDYKAYKPNLATNCFLREETLPDGFDCSIVDFKTLEWLNNSLPLDSVHREHVLTYVMENEKDFIVYKKNYDLGDFKSVRLTVDKPNDLILIKDLYDNLYDKNNYFGLKEIKWFWENNKILFNINKESVRDESYYALL